MKGQSRGFLYIPYTVRVKTREINVNNSNLKMLLKIIVLNKEDSTYQIYPKSL